MQMHNTVLVEECIQGADFRILVSSGTMQWAFRRFPAQLVGDGRRSITHLIQDENKRRKDDRISSLPLVEIKIDQDLIDNINKQNYSLDSVLPNNTTIRLRSAANLSLGGTLEDFTKRINKENILMVETIARVFRLGTVGIDLICPNIELPWYEQKCAIIEINYGPQMIGGDYAKSIIESQFPNKINGRIPVIVLVSNSEAFFELTSKLLIKQFDVFGCISNSFFEFGGLKKLNSSQSIVSKIQAALCDPAYQALLIAIDGNLDSNSKCNFL